MNEILKMKKLISYDSGSSRNATRTHRKNAQTMSRSTIYTQVNQSTKIYENWYKNEIQRIKKDIEEGSLTNSEMTMKYMGHEYSEDLRLRMREARFETSGFSFLHLAAINCRGTFCEFLIDHIRIDKNVLCKGNLNALHSLIRSNVFLKQDLNSEKYQLVIKLWALNIVYLNE